MKNSLALRVWGSHQERVARRWRVPLLCPAGLEFGVQVFKVWRLGGVGVWGSGLHCLEIGGGLEFGVQGFKGLEFEV